MIINDANANKKSILELRIASNNIKNTCANIDDSTGRIMVNGDERKERCRQYFDELYNAGKSQETNMNRIGLGVQ